MVVPTLTTVDPYTRPDASASPTTTASAIDSTDTSSVTTAARASDGRYARACTDVVVGTPLALSFVRNTRSKNGRCVSSHTFQRRKICSSDPSRIASRNTASMESRSIALACASTPT